MAPREIPHRELRNNSSQVLRDVQNGETFAITNHGEVVAIISPPDQPPPRTLRSRKATRRGGFSEIRRVRIEGTTQESLDELRGDR